MLEFVRENALWITLIALITGCILGWLMFDKNDWGK